MTAPFSATLTLTALAGLVLWAAPLAAQTTAPAPSTAQQPNAHMEVIHHPN